MKVFTARGITADLCALLILVSSTAITSAQTESKSLKNQLVGHWQLVSVSLNTSPPYGANPQGSMFLDAGGHYSVIVISAGNARSVAYFGTYTVDDSESSITMHIDASNLASAAGRDEKRFLTFSGDELTIASQQSHGPIGPLKLNWRRAN
jgi:hypothetical protein